MEIMECKTFSTYWSVCIWGVPPQTRGADLTFDNVEAGSRIVGPDGRNGLKPQKPQTDLIKSNQEMHIDWAYLVTVDDDGQ